MCCVVAILPPTQVDHLRKALFASYGIVTADSWSLLEAVIRAEPVSVAIVDPTIAGTGGVACVERLIRKYSSLPFVAYVQVNAQSLRAIARLARLGLHEVVLVGHDDSPPQFRETIEKAIVSRPTELFLEKLRPFLGILPGQVAVAVEKLFQLPYVYRGTKELAVAAGVTMSGLYRSFKAAGLSSPRQFMTAARVLRGYNYLSEPGYSVEHVAAKTGYKSSRAFVRHIREVFGVSPSRLRSTFSEAETLDQLYGWLIESSDLVLHCYAAQSNQGFAKAK